MHDPMILVASIRRPPITSKERRHTYWPALVDIWHVEPDGKDAGTVCKVRGRNGRRLLLHVNHLSVRFIPWRNLRHRFTRCATCGRRMNTAMRIGTMGGDEVWHYECSGYAGLVRERLLLSEVLDRLFVTHHITSRDVLAQAVNRPERRDQFLLSYAPWEMVDKYRHLPPEERWKAPNEHLYSATYAGDDPA